ncbi:MAG: Ig-like domain-containing protein [Gemmatimonadales bacterium]|jgi:hypothetical protein
MTANSRLVIGSLVAWLGAGLVVGCSDSSGPGDTTIDLAVDSVISPTNDLVPTVSGITEPGASVTVIGPRDTLNQLADGTGGFALTVRLWPDAVNTIAVSATDSAGNQIGDTLEVAHDGRVPVVSFASPGSGEITPGQSGFAIVTGYADQGSGGIFVSEVDPTSLRIESDGTVGGMFQRDGTISTAYAPGTNLAPLFDAVGAKEATLAVPDSLAFAPGSHQLRAHVTDFAGNVSPPGLRTFEVTADPDRLIAVDASGAAGSSGNALPVALVNGDTVAGVQFDLVYSTAIISTVEAVAVTDRSASFGATDFNEVAPGRVRVLLFDVDGDVIPPGQGPILTLSVAVQPGVPAGTYGLTLTSVLLSGPGGQTAGGPDASGIFQVP